MKSHTLLALTLFLAAPCALTAAVFKKAEVTRVLNDVRVLPDQSDAAPARIGDVITGKTAVATGVSSRAELKFPDNTLTRLGANTLFRLEEGTRDIDLQQGVLLLQVPKQLGGARVRTAAVTAAVTGTTILVEYQPDGYIKIIVIEGQVDLFMRDKPSNFITLKAGDMIVMKADAKTFPLPVQVDLERLMKTSKLLDPNEFGPIGNGQQINNALNQQGNLKKDGELLNTAFMLPGRGTKITLTNEVRREILRFQDPPKENAPGSPPPPSGGNQGTNPPANGGPGPNPGTPRPYIPGTTYITDNDPIATNPHITAYSSLTDSRVASEGFFYQRSVDGQPGTALFGKPPEPSPLDLLVNAAGLWAAFHFEDLVIVGNPTVNSTTGARNLLLASDGGISLQSNFYYEIPVSGAPIGSGQILLDSSLDNFMLASNQGPIILDSNFRISGTNQGVVIQTFGADADIRIDGSYPTTHIELPDGIVHIAAGRDILFATAGILAAAVHLDAKRDVNLSGGTQIQAKNNVDISAGRSITITDSSQIVALTYMDPLDIRLKALSGDLTLTDSELSGRDITLEAHLANLVLTNSTINGNVIRARSLGANGELLINGTSFDAITALKLYAEGSNGQVRFTGNSFINSPSTDIAGKTVTIDPGVRVNVSEPAGLRVYTDNPNFSNNTANGYGQFTTGETNSPFTVNQQGFGNRPGF